MTNTLLNDTDKQLLQQKGITEAVFEEQIQRFEKGVAPVNLAKPAVLGDGLFKLDDASITKLLEQYRNALQSGKQVQKFVPASGAASRMFKSLHAFVNEGEKSSDVDEVLNKLSDFAFYNDLVSALQKDGIAISDASPETIIKYILEETGLGYSAKPKGLLKFHLYLDGARTTIEEHLVEGAQYAANVDGKVAIHFTVSPEHKEAIRKLIDRVKGIYEEEFGVQYEITYSEQKPSTDTVAVDMNDKPFRNEDGSLLFRPGGHGALLENLNDLNTDIVFVKNIDNVVPDYLRGETIKYKAALAGLLVNLQEKVFLILNQLETGEVAEGGYAVIKEFAEKELNVSFNDDFDALDEKAKAEVLTDKLNCPIRICGMVKNEGEPGGGPFWVAANGTTSLQIVEKSQVDMENVQQADILAQSTHFNPVDLICGVKDYKGNKFDLLQYRDPETAFISQKSKDGKDLKALELPGLWNGAMAYWNTIFVEVPLITFNPVKTVNDLLRREHQPE